MRLHDAVLPSASGYPTGTSREHTSKFVSTLTTLFTNPTRFEILPRDRLWVPLDVFITRVNDGRGDSIACYC